MTSTLFGTGWPDPASIPIKGRGYATPDGLFPRVTSILKVAGLGTEGLIKWSANLERSAVLEAIGDVIADGAPDSPAEVIAAVEARLGHARQHQRALEKAGEIGTEIHARIKWHVRRELGLTVGPEPYLSAPAALGFTSWRAWYAGAKLTPYLVEQPVWDPEWGYAGTIDYIGIAQPECPYGPAGSRVLADWKSAAGIYETYHMQAAAYIRAANRWEEVLPGPIVWIPKKADGPLEVKPHTLGHLYGGKVRTYEQLLEGFKAALTIYRIFVEDAA